MDSRSGVAARRTAHRFRNGMLSLGALVATSALLAGGTTVAQAAENISDGPLTVVLGVGETESERIVSWYYPDGTPQVLQVEPTADLADGEFDAEAESVTPSTAANTALDTSTTNGSTSGIEGITNQSGYYNSHATISDLEPATDYSYRVGAADGSHWSPVYEFSTPDEDSNFDFLFFGDPQLGSSGDALLDAAGWENTLDYVAANEDAELYVSGGDQVENANNELQWSVFFDSNDELKENTWASTIGNHDVGGKAYEQHNLVPNWSRIAELYSSSTNSGGDYWYYWKDVLFIDINSNAYAGASDAQHVSYVSDVVNRFGDDAKWTVLVYHHAIYSPASHANDLDNQKRRMDFTRAFSDLGVDLVLQGHDHSYSRSYSIMNGKKANENEQPGQSEVVTGPGGVIYVTANSASGSKYYDLTEPVKGVGFGPDPLDAGDADGDGHIRHFANSVENQEHVANYTRVSVTDDALTLDTIRAGDCDAPNPAVERGNVEGCGVTLNADPAPIGSSVDAVTIHQDAPDTTTTLDASTTTLTYGETTPVELTAVVAGGLGDAVGEVMFYDGDELLGTTELTDGEARLEVPAAQLTVGEHVFTARFESGSVYFGADSTSDAVTVVVEKAESSTTLKYSHKTASVRVKAGDLDVDGRATITEHGKILKSVHIVDGEGSVTLKLSKGTHKLTAKFEGSATIDSSSDKLTVKIKK